MALEDRLASAARSPTKLTVVGEFDPGTGFGKKFDVLSCGHMRRQEKDGIPDVESSADDLPVGEVYCWQGCHEIES